MQKHLYDIRYEVDEKEWRAQAKRSLIFQFWEVYKPASKNQKMLDYGCGSGVLQSQFEHKYPWVTAYGIDIAENAIQYSKQRGLKRVSMYDGEIIPFPDSSFDLVTAIDVIEHVKDDNQALREITRVLKPDGIGIFIVPAYMHLWSTRDIRLNHYRRYEPNELESKSKQAGLTMLCQKNVDFLLYFILWMMRNMAPKKNGVPDLAMETVYRKSLLNDLIYFYEFFEMKWLKFFNFPTGISKLVIVKKSQSM